MPASRSHSDNLIFYGLLALLIWLPIPLGSNRAWAWSLMEAWIFILAAGWLWLFIKEKVTLPRYWNKTVLLWGSLCGFCLVIAVQLLPLPKGLITAISPAKAQYWGNNQNWVTLSLDPQLTFIHLLQSVSFTLIAILVIVLVRRAERLKLLLGTIVLSGLIQAVYGSVVALSNNASGLALVDVAFSGSANGTFWNRNHFANYLALCLSAGTSLLLASLYDRNSINWRDRSRRLLQTLLGPKARMRISLAIMVIAIVLSRSRMGNTAFFFGLFGTAILWLLLTKRITRGSMLLLASLLIVDLFIVGAWFGLDKVRDRLENSTYTTPIASQEIKTPTVEIPEVEVNVDVDVDVKTEAENVELKESQPQTIKNEDIKISKRNQKTPETSNKKMSDGRGEVTRDSITLLANHWVIGTGAGSFYGVFPKYRSDDIHAFFDHAHNDYAELLVEHGILAVLALFTLIIAALTQSVKAMRQRKSLLFQAAAFAPAMAITVMIIHGTVEFNLQIPANSATFIVLVSLAWVANLMPSRRKRQN